MHASQVMVVQGGRADIVLGSPVSTRRRRVYGASIDHNHRHRSAEEVVDQPAVDMSRLESDAPSSLRFHVDAITTEV
jgi:hypothetical protein